jgi:prephenate dehydrogenase
MRVAILGFGLIGGSIARALAERQPNGWSVAAWSRSADGPSRAVADGVIDSAAIDAGQAIDGAELVVLAAPPLACLGLLDDLAGEQSSRLSPDAVITDVASTKRRIVARAMELGLRFVGGHPMTGRELTGYEASDAGLFVDRPWLLCGHPQDAGRVESLANAAGARPVWIDPAVHDAAVASVSHLPLLVSAALAEAVARGASTWREHLELAAGGWQSMTRLAHGDPDMGAGILATNADYVGDRLRILRTVIDEWIEALEAQQIDTDALTGRLSAAKTALEGDAS